MFTPPDSQLSISISNADAVFTIGRTVRNSGGTLSNASEIKARWKVPMATRRLVTRLVIDSLPNRTASFLIISSTITSLSLRLFDLPSVSSHTGFAVRILRVGDVKEDSLSVLRSWQEMQSA